MWKHCTVHVFGICENFVQFMFMVYVKTLYSPCFWYMWKLCTFHVFGICENIVQFMFLVYVKTLYISCFWYMWKHCTVHVFGVCENIVQFMFLVYVKTLYSSCFLWFLDIHINPKLIFINTPGPRRSAIKIKPAIKQNSFYKAITSSFRLCVLMNDNF